MQAVVACDAGINLMIFWDLYVENNSDHVIRVLLKETDAIAVIVEMTDEYIKFLSLEAKQTTNQRQKYVFYFVLMYRKFLLFFNCVKTGDRVAQEHITFEWLLILC